MMRCSGCGKRIPERGHVCPYCQRDKAGDQAISAVTTACMIIGGIAGYFVEGFAGALLGGIIGGIVGAIIGAVGNRDVGTAPPVVTIADGKVHLGASDLSSELGTNEIKRRLARLDDLRSKAILTEQEYASRRAEIIDSL